MPAAIDRALRVKLVQAHAEGRSYSSLARQYNVAYNTVRTLCIRHAREGEAGLVPRYQACGPKAIKHEPLLYRAACYLKRRHGQWGASMIRLQLQERYPEHTIPAVRTMQTWFKNAGLKVPRSRVPRQEKKEPEPSTRSGK